MARQERTLPRTQSHARPKAGRETTRRGTRPTASRRFFVERRGTTLIVPYAQPRPRDTRSGGGRTPRASTPRTTRRRKA